MGRGVSIRRRAVQAAADLAAAAGAKRLTGEVVVRCEAGGLVCEVRVGPADGSARSSGVRAACRRDILAVVAAADRPLPWRRVLRALRDAGMTHGTSTVAKALADLTREKALVNPRDKRGYRLKDWPLGRRDQPRLPGL